MRFTTLTTIAAGLAVGFVLTTARTASGDQYARRDGQRFDGAVLEASADEVKFRLRNGKEQVLAGAELSPDSHYAALAKHLAPASATERLALARTCLDAKLFAPARAESKRAALDEPALAVDAASISSGADEGEAGDLLARGLEQMAGGDERGTHLLLQVLNRFPHSGALPAAAAGLRNWTAGVLPVAAPKDGPGKQPAPGTGGSDPVFAGVVSALQRARSATTSGSKTPVNRGDKRLRFFRAAETELEAARRWVVAIKRADRATAAACDERLRELKEAFLELAVAAGGALLDSGRTSDARRFIYLGLSIDPAHAPLLDLQARLAAELLDNPDASSMSLAELSRRVARGTATMEMLRIYTRRIADRGLAPASGPAATPPATVPGRQADPAPAPLPDPPPPPAPSPQRPNGG